MSARAEGERIARLLGLERLPGEGGPDFSALHMLDGVET